MAGVPSDPDVQQCHLGDSKNMTFTMSNYISNALKVMHTMQNHQMLTDVVIEVGNDTYHAHRVLLASASPYFKTMFTGGRKEMDMPSIKIQEVGPTALRLILDFIYTGDIRISEVTVSSLLAGATVFQVTDIIKACCLFLEKHFEPSNVIGISKFAEKHGCKELSCKATSYIEQHFEQVCCEDEFFQLTAMQLVKLVRRDTLNVMEERVVYNAVVQWVKFDEDGRQSTLQDVLHAVRCQHLPPNFLRDQVNNCDLVRKSPKCMQYLANIFKDLTLHKKPLQKARTPNTPRIIYLVGGYVEYSMDIVEAYNVDENTWISLTKLSLPLTGLGGAFLNGLFYAIGGRKFTKKKKVFDPKVAKRKHSPCRGYDSDWVDCYNPGLGQWRPCSPMSIARNRVGVAVLDGLLYAIGGCSGNTHHKSVERYDPDTDRWDEVSPMHEARIGAGVAVINRILYAVGGFDGNKRINTAECYHPENDAWTKIPPMTFARSGVGVAAVDNYLYVVGGCDGRVQLDVVERYDTESGVWERVQNLSTPRSALTLTELDGKLYAMGGFDGSTFVNYIEVYDPALDKWEEGGSLTEGRSGHASAVTYQRCRIHCKDNEAGIDAFNEPPRTAIASCLADRPPRYDEQTPTARPANADLMRSYASQDNLPEILENTSSFQPSANEHKLPPAVEQTDVENILHNVENDSDRQRTL